MATRFVPILFLAASALAVAAAGARAQQPPKSASRSPAAAAPAVPAPPNGPAPYDEQLARLSEILGAVHYLRTLCAAAGSDDWRQSMRDLLDADTVNEPQRRKEMTAAFNRGYRSFAAVYVSCTPAAIVAEESYRNEGATLAREIVSRFGN